MMEKFEKKWIDIENSHKVSKVATNQFWKLAISELQAIFDFKQKSKITRKIPQFVTVRRRLHNKHVPRISLQIAYKHKETGEITVVEDSTTTPSSKFPPNEYIKLYEQATVQVQIKINFTHSTFLKECQ